MELTNVVRVIYAVNFGIIMSLTPLLYIINHPKIFIIGFSEESKVGIYPFIITFIVYKSVARFANGLALINNYLFGNEHDKNLGYFMIYLIYTLLLEWCVICYFKELNINMFAITYLCRQYLYSSIDYSLDQLDSNYNQGYRVIGILLLLIPLYGVVQPNNLAISLNMMYLTNIICLKFCIYSISVYRFKSRNKKRKEENKKDIYLRNISNGRISIDKFIWVCIMLLFVSYIDGAGDAIATEKLWNNNDSSYFIINMVVRIFASLITYPPIQQKLVNRKNNTKIIIKLMMFRFLLLLIMKYVSFKELVFFIQSSIDIFVGTIFMNDYLDKNKKLFMNTTSTSKYYVSSSVAYFINENVPPLIKLVLVYNLIQIGKKIDIGIYFIVPLMGFAIISIKMISIIQKKIN
tara:strand:- start:3766 stop:4983 length:1218 start_codon:yes stop_codon:yes gene_type:complete